MKETWGIKGFIHTSFIDWPGKVCSVIFLQGCGFRCPTCHNESLVKKSGSMPDYPLDSILSFLDSRRKWIDGITVTGGEPTFRPTLPDLLTCFRQRSVKIKLDTNGSNPRMLESLIDSGLVDAVYMDVKAPLSSAKYSVVTGVQIDVDLIKRSIAILKCSGLEVAFRTTVIPSLVEEAELAEIRHSLGDVQRYLVQAFRNVDTLRADFAGREEFGQERIDRMRECFELPSAVPLTARYATAG
ncbi:MAG: anaerobic ribonucleoside-triphosphate reductase activating protein [Desulfomonilaceae bacterium]